MKSFLLSVLALSALLTAGSISVTPSPPESASAELHLRLDSAAPSPGSEVESLERVRLWFSQAPQEGSVRVRLTAAAGEVERATVNVNPEDDTDFLASLEAPASPGVHTVAWRAIADDNHVVSGDFTVTVVGR
ncbi:MAG: copper resistance protein CopC [Gemmatimonadetes bacterium]|nr:copper resistance protein CopC [Gemmatimonadota bacterium]